MPTSLAIALAKSVLPTPGGPTKSMPLGTWAPEAEYLAGLEIMSMTSRISCLACSLPMSSASVLGALGLIAGVLKRKGNMRRQMLLGALESARGGSGKMIDMSREYWMRMTRAPNSALEMMETTEYFMSAGNEVNGFHCWAVKRRMIVQPIRSVHFAHGFMFFVLSSSAAGPAANCFGLVGRAQREIAVPLVGPLVDAAHYFGRSRPVDVIHLPDGHVVALETILDLVHVIYANRPW